MLGRKGDITIRIASLSISNNSFIGEQIMARLDELLAKIETISLGGGVDNSVEIAEINMHLLEECKERDHFKECEKCKTPILIDFLKEHIKSNTC